LKAPVDVWLIHGLGDSPRVWRAVRKDPRFRFYRFISPALPGHSGTPALAPRRRNLEGLARWLEAQIDRRSRGRRVVLVGHSMGGMIVTLLGARRPELTGLVNIEGNLTLDDCFTAKRASRTADFPRWFRMFRQEVRRPESGAPAHYAISVAGADPATFRACARDIVSYARRARMGKVYASLKLPSVYFYGCAADGISKTTVRLLRNRDLRTRRFAAAGHWPMVETPERFAKALYAVLATTGRKTKSE
jgi:pimeloyl-ACP methyl ester carboxylesterase